VIVYIDTEFTDLYADNGPIRLISAGFVAENGQELYFELTDNYEVIDCSEFVLENVLTYLDHGKYGLTTAEAALKLKAWCEGLGGRIQFATDAPMYDYKLIAEMLFYQSVIIENLDMQALYFNAVDIEYKIQKYFEENPDAYRHNALADARALASVFARP
jgi:hypothetical protein